MKLKGKRRWPLPIDPKLLLLFLLSYASTAAAQTAGTFIPRGNMIKPRSGDTATLLLNGKVLIAGGWDQKSQAVAIALASAELFDPVTGTFTATSNMTIPRSAHSATLLPDGRVLICGGDGPGGLLATAELYDPSTGTFTATGNMIHSRTQQCHKA